MLNFEEESIYRIRIGYSISEAICPLNGSVSREHLTRSIQNEGIRSVTCNSSVTMAATCFLQLLPEREEIQSAILQVSEAGASTVHTWRKISAAMVEDNLLSGIILLVFLVRSTFHRCFDDLRKSGFLLTIFMILSAFGHTVLFFHPEENFSFVRVHCALREPVPSIPAYFRPSPPSGLR